VAALPRGPCAARSAPCGSSSLPLRLRPAAAFPLEEVALRPCPWIPRAARPVGGCEGGRVEEGRSCLRGGAFSLSPSAPGRLPLSAAVPDPFSGRPVAVVACPRPSPRRRARAVVEVAEVRGGTQARHARGASSNLVIPLDGEAARSRSLAGVVSRTGEGGVPCLVSCDIDTDA
jgi:hypothetical protein